MTATDRTMVIDAFRRLNDKLMNDREGMRDLLMLYENIDLNELIPCECNECGWKGVSGDLFDDGLGRSICPECGTHAITESQPSPGGSADGVPVCCICGRPCDDEFGNNPWPVRNEGRCCLACNGAYVIPARMDRARGDLHD